MASAELHVTQGTVTIAPMEARMRLGLNRSVAGSQMMTASAPAASALRSTAPRLPGFSTLSRTAMSGAAFRLPSFRLPSSRLRALTSATIPSVPSLYAIFPYNSELTSNIRQLEGRSRSEEHTSELQSPDHLV